MPRYVVATSDDADKEHGTGVVLGETIAQNPEEAIIEVATNIVGDNSLLKELNFISAFEYLKMTLEEADDRSCSEVKISVWQVHRKRSQNELEMHR